MVGCASVFFLVEKAGSTSKFRWGIVDPDRSCLLSLSFSKGCSEAVVEKRGGRGCWLVNCQVGVFDLEQGTNFSFHLAEHAPRKIKDTMDLGQTVRKVHTVTPGLLYPCTTIATTTIPNAPLKIPRLHIDDVTETPGFQETRVPLALKDAPGTQHLEDNSRVRYPERSTRPPLAPSHHVPTPIHLRPIKKDSPPAYPALTQVCSRMRTNFLPIYMTKAEHWVRIENIPSFPETSECVTHEEDKGAACNLVVELSGVKLNHTRCKVDILPLLRLNQASTIFKFRFGTVVRDERYDKVVRRMQNMVLSAQEDGAGQTFLDEEVGEVEVCGWRGRAVRLGAGEGMQIVIARVMREMRREMRRE
ncbi:hypothetical protein P154DRAFT_596499 [Amniculicola lignicola CBS 123094]|uniref:Uncharacterized protein n=1 Tax=Amniculicola lignicola CBS 123094 TaxID=1392246 RepID=A0A6A5WUT9_9PLEO|nr:hypothetical protein P154DRAFT_596499 [Amniculicola lignicola CBS 123094]